MLSIHKILTEVINIWSGFTIYQHFLHSKAMKLTDYIRVYRITAVLSQKIYLFWKNLKHKNVWEKQTNVKIEECNSFTEWTNSDPHTLLSNVNEQE